MAICRTGRAHHRHRPLRCVGARPQSPADLQAPVNALERDLDPDGVWRRYANDALAGPYQTLFGRLDQLVLLAAPVGQMDAIMAAMAPHLRPGTIVTDAGSTKFNVVEAARAALGDRFADFVPGHPIAGSEQCGPGAARIDLYRGKRVVLTPQIDTRADAVATVRLLWEAAGAQVETLDAGLHDRVFAAVSHLPHLAAYALVDDLAQRADSDTCFRFAASGFRDFTRIAGSSPEMWRDIALANREAVLAELDAYLASLQALRQAVDAEDANALLKMFSRARNARENWIKAQDS